MDPVTEPLNTNVGDGGAWKTELPETLRSHEAFAPYNTKSDLWTGVAKLHDDHKTAVQKATDLEGKLATSIPKLPENASQQDKDLFYTALGRPEKAEEYELAKPPDGKPLMDDKMALSVKNLFYQNGLNKEQGQALSGWWNATIEAMIADSQQAATAKEAELKLKMGDEGFKTAVETTKRVWGKFTNPEAEKFLTTATLQDGSVLGNNPFFIDFVFNIAKLTGEDKAPPGGPPRSNGGAGDRSGWFPNSPKSPTGK